MGINNIKNDNITISKDLKEFVYFQKDLPGSLINILHKTQEEYKYLPKNIIIQISEITNIPVARIYGIATFYHFFKLQPPGKYEISVCIGTACYLKGSQEILDEFEKTLKVRSGGTTEDGLFSIQPVRCLGCCGLAPVVSINGDIYAKVSKDNVYQIINNFQKEISL